METTNATLFAPTTSSSMRQRIDSNVSIVINHAKLAIQSLGSASLVKLQLELTDKVEREHSLTIKEAVIWSLVMAKMLTRSILNVENADGIRSSSP